MSVDLEAEGATALYALLHVAGGALPHRLAGLAHGHMVPARTDAEVREAWGRPLGHSRACGAIVEDTTAWTLTLAPRNDLTRAMLAALAECPDTLARAKRALKWALKASAKISRLDTRLARRTP